MKKLIICGMALLMVLALSQNVYAVGAGGFENATFSAKQIGRSGAVVATADEPAAISYNPAGIADLPGVQVQGNIAFINQWTHYSSDTISNTRSSATINPIPTGYVTINPGRIFCDRFAIGIGSDSPFGLSTKYHSNHEIARYTGYHTFLKMYTLKPVAAIKLTDWWSVGAGPMHYRVFDFGGVQAYPNQIIVPGLPDGQVRLNLSGNSWGWQIGTLVRPNDKHSLGFYFRSPVDLRLRGQVKVERSAFAGNFETGGHLKMTLPSNFTVAYAFSPTERTTVEVDFGVTRWSSYDRSYINSDPVSAFDDIILNAIGKADKDWRNGFSLQIGADHKLTDKLTVRGGSYYYWTPVPKTHWIPAVPDSNRLAFSLGLSYAIRKDLDIGASYLGIMALRRRIDNEISESLGTTVDGKYFSYAQDWIISMTYHWDDIFPRVGKKTEEKISAPLAVIN